MTPTDADVPTALAVRPTLTIRTPFAMLRVPRRSGTLCLVAALVWFVGWALFALPLQTMTSVTLGPALLLSLLVDVRIQGRLPLLWGVILLRHVRRPHILVYRRLASLPRRSQWGR